jgi:hypothetical protein
MERLENPKELVSLGCFLGENPYVVVPLLHSCFRHRIPPVLSVGVAGWGQLVGGELATWQQRWDGRMGGGWPPVTWKVVGWVVVGCRLEAALGRVLGFGCVGCFLG